VLKEGGKVWTNFLTGGNVPEVTRYTLEISRAHLAGRFKQVSAEVGVDMKRQGMELLKNQDRISCRDLFRQLAAYGLFVVPCGELESWLPHLQVAGKAPEWLINVFDKLGSEPSSETYVWPSGEDVWAFVASVAAWIDDPRRQGMDL
jgi:hypothetical protein